MTLAEVNTTGAKLEEVNTMLTGTGLPVAYHHFAAPVSPPFVAYYSEGWECFAADGTIYNHDEIIRIELYADTKDLTSEGLIETALAGHYFTKECTYIDEEHLYLTIYILEV